MHIVLTAFISMVDAGGDHRRQRMNAV